MFKACYQYIYIYIYMSVISQIKKEFLQTLVPLMQIYVDIDA